MLCDAVLNHRCAHAQSPTGVWNRFGGGMPWDARAIVSDDPHFEGEGNPSTGDHFHAAPNVDHSQPEGASQRRAARVSFSPRARALTRGAAFWCVSPPTVRRDIATWMSWLVQTVGFDGWRLDFVRGFGGEAVKEYLSATQPSFAVGEFWDTSALRCASRERELNRFRSFFLFPADARTPFQWITAAPSRCTTRTRTGSGSSTG